jgi:hypothetical protein
VAFHAAMVADQDRGILLCAPRESGKGTLTVSLVARGFDLLTDEPALLRLDTGTVSPLCFPVSLKKGSWPVLLSLWPKLVDAPLHVRSDGTEIRLLHAPQARLSSLPRRLTHFIFPEYSPSSSDETKQLSPLHALGFLNEGGMLLSRHLKRITLKHF